jgi:ribose-phosphate pyrophosphokinase
LPQRVRCGTMDPTSQRRAWPQAAQSMKFLCLDATHALGSRIAAAASCALAAHEEREFADTEFKVRPLDNVEGEQVVVCQSLVGDEEQSASDKLMRLLTLIGAVKDAGADRLCALVPYLAFARKDRRTRPGDPVTTRYVAALFEAVGTDTVVTADVHNLAAFENAFRCRTIHVEAAPLFVEHFARKLVGGDRPVVLSPDAGGMKRAQLFAQAFAQRIGAPVDLALMEKRRSGGRIDGAAFGGDVRGAAVIIVDDMIGSGTTVLRAAHAAMERGAAAVHAAATHAVFAPETAETLSSTALESIVVTDTVGDPRARCPALGSKLEILHSASLFAAVLRRIARC